MGVVFRQSIKTTAVIFFGSLLGAITIFIYPYILTKPELGFTRNIINHAAIAQIAVLMGTHQALQTFLQRYAYGDERRNVLSSISFITPLLATVLLTVPYFLFKEQIVALYQPEDRPYVSMFYLWTPLLVLLWSFMTTFELFFISETRAAVGSFMREVLIRICALVIIALYCLHIINFKGLVIGTVLSYALPPMLMFLMAKGKHHFALSFRWNAFSRKEYKELFHFSWYHLLTGISINLLGFLDSLMLPILDRNGLSSLSAYAIAIYITTIITIPYRAMSNASFPILNKAYIQGDKKELETLFHRSSINILIVSVGMFIVIGCNLNNIMAFLPANYDEIPLLIIILMVGRLIDMSTGLNSILISITKLYKFNFRASVVLIIIMVSLNYLLIPEYGAYGAAIGSTIAIGAYNILNLIYLYVKMKLQPFTYRSLLVISAAIPAALAGYFLPELFAQTGNKILAAVLDAGVRTIITGLIYVLLLIWLKASTDMNDYLLSIKKNKRLF